MLHAHARIQTSTRRYPKEIILYESSQFLICKIRITNDICLRDNCTSTKLRAQQCWRSQFLIDALLVRESNGVEKKRPICTYLNLNSFELYLAPHTLNQLLSIFYKSAVSLCACGFRRKKVVRLGQENRFIATECTACALHKHPAHKHYIWHRRQLRQTSPTKSNGAMQWAKIENE